MIVDTEPTQPILKSNIIKVYPAPLFFTLPLSSFNTYIVYIQEEQPLNYPMVGPKANHRQSNNW